MKQKNKIRNVYDAIVFWYHVHLKFFLMLISVKLNDNCNKVPHVVQWVNKDC